MIAPAFLTASQHYSDSKVTGLTALDENRVLRSDRIGPRTVTHSRIESLDMELILRISKVQVSDVL